MAWGGSPSDPDQLRGMREAGLNISGFCHPEDLDKVRSAGLTCFVSDPRLENLDHEMCWWRLFPTRSQPPRDESLMATRIDRLDEIAPFIVKLRIAKGVSQTELAKRLRVSK